ncbi:MAG: SDR family NAD(P)-dependent oxidoreductase [Pseudomonadota bacterium]
MMNWLKAGNLAVVTGAAGGIGLESAKRFAEAGMTVILVDIKDEALSAAETALAGADGCVVSRRCDVSDSDAVKALAAEIDAEFGPVHALMNNAGIGRMGTKPWEDLEAFHGLVSINLMGVVHGCHAFIPGMLAHGEPAAVINTGSKQGITRPPGNYAYNLSKAGVLAYTESVAHALRQEADCQISAHLLIPAFVYTPMVAAFIPQKPAFAASAEETVDFMMTALAHGDFYILCPDPETPRPLDEKRVQWTADDIIKNRPALSRWHPDYEQAYKAFIEG